MLAAPPRSPYDLGFRLADIPVRIHWTFWLVSVIFTFDYAAGNALILLLSVLAFFISIMVHELGHVLSARAMNPKCRPHIVLYGCGGLAIGGIGLRPIQRILMTAAGPGAGLLLGVASYIPYKLLETSPAIVGPLGAFLYIMIQINFLWSLLNLVPVQPLDGGWIVYEWMAIRDKKTAAKRAHIIAMVVTPIVAIVCFVIGQTFAAFLLILLAIFSYQTHKQDNAGGRAGRQRRAASEETRESWQRNSDWWKE